MRELRLSGDEGKLLGFLLAPDVYGECLTSEVSDVLGLGTEVRSNDLSPRITTIPEGLFDNAILKDIKLYHGDSQDYAARLFVKLQHPLRGKFGEELEKILNTPGEKGKPERGREKKAKRIEKLFRKAEDNAVYQAQHLSYWNELGVPAPIFLFLYRQRELTSKLVDSELAQEIGLPEFTLSAIFETYVDGPTNDKTLIAIQERIKKNKDKLDDPHTDNETRAKLLGANQGLEQILDETRMSMLETTSLLSILGTHGIMHQGKNIKVNRIAPNSLLDNLERQIHAFLQWRMVGNGTRPVEDVIAEYREGAQRKVGKEFRRLFKDVVALLEDAQYAVYRQGDESPHNFKRTKDQRTTKGSLQSVIMDPDMAVMSVPELGESKILVNNITGLDYEGMLDYSERRRARERELVRELKKSGRVAPDFHYDFNNKSSRMRSKVATFYDGLSLMGQKAKHDMYPYWKRKYQLLEDERGEYKNRHILFPTDDVMYYSNTPYNPKGAIEVLRGTVGAVLGYMLTDKSFSEQRGALEKIKGFLEKEGILG